MKNNISLFILAVSLFCTTTHAQKTEKVFNGKDLSNWEFVIEKNEVPTENVFKVVNNKILISGQPFGYMYTKKKYRNFQLQVEWRWVDGKASNSGIFLLIEKFGNPFPTGIECQLHAGDAGDLVLLSGSNLEEYQTPKGQTRPRFPVIKKNTTSSEKPAGEWNRANIFVKDGVITVFINGVYQNTGTSKVKEGNIALQSEGEPIEFRKVDVRIID